jgi:hypothetical protein
MQEIRQIVSLPEETLQAIIQKLLAWELILCPASEPKPVASKEETQQSSTPPSRNFGDGAQARIRQKYETLAKNDHFRTLELDWHASKASIDKQYFRLSKEFHPDRFFKEDIGPFKEMLDEVFNGIQQAYGVLSDEAQRKAHLKMLRTPKSANQNGASAPQGAKVGSHSKTKPEFSSPQNQYQMGKEEEAKGNLKAALNFYKMARIMDRDNEDVSSALRRVKEAIKKNPLTN